MSARPNRRAMLMAGVGLGALVLGAGGYEGWRLFGKHYPATPYDDLFALLPDREAAQKLAAHVRVYGDIYIRGENDIAARDLRARIQRSSFAGLLGQDIRENRVAEVAGWVMPTTLVEMLWLVQQTT